jgi:hypothetical protein
MRFDLCRYGLLLAAGFSLVVVVSGQSQQGMGSGSPGAARTYAKPRTKGIIDPKARVVFEDVTARTAMSSFHHRAGGSAKDYILEAPSGGVAIFDYDSDGLPDIYLLNGSTFEALRGDEKPPRAALFRNRGNWNFVETTGTAGVANERWGFGAAVGDYNNDGHPDLFVANYGVSRLYRNNGNGSFTDVASDVGLARKGWSTGASWGDYDTDGRLDLFVPGYVEFDPDNRPAAPANRADPSICRYRGIPVFCGPRGLRGEGDSLYRQKPDGTFEDVSIKAGVHDPLGYYGMSAVFVDVDNDAHLDLFVTNDSTPNYLYRNRGDGTFEDASFASGVALNESAREQASMGLAVGDYDNDGLVDFYVTNFSDESNTLYRNEGEGAFSDATYQAGHGEVTVLFLGWGTSFLDFDNDGWKDVVVANGHVYPQVDAQKWGTSYGQQMLLFRNLGTGVFKRIEAAPESGLARPFQGRGLAVGDLDGDGLPDVVMANADSAPTILRNAGRPAGHWLELQLIGDPAKNSPRDGIGAVVWVSTGELRQRVDAVSGGGYCSQNDPRLHFGLGPFAKVDRLQVRWPGGMTEEHAVPSVDRVMVLTQGKGKQY